MYIPNQILTATIFAFSLQALFPIAANAEDGQTGIALMGFSALIAAAQIDAVLCDRDIAARWIEQKMKTKTVSVSTVSYAGAISMMIAKARVVAFQKMDESTRADYCKKVESAYGTQGTSIRGFLK